MRPTGMGSSLAPPQQPQAPKNHDRSALIADWEEIVEITLLTFSLPTVLFNLLPPSLRGPVGTVAAGVLWHKAVTTTTPAYQYQPPVTAKQERIRAMFAFAPFIGVYATQAYLMHNSQKMEAANSAWSRACASHPLLRPIANYPGPAVIMRVAGQMTAASIGVALRTMYDTQVQGRHAQPSGGTGEVKIGQVVKSIASSPGDSLTVACVFALPALAFLPGVRAKVGSYFAGAASRVVPELLSSTGVVAALVLLSGAGAKRPSPLALPSPSHPENEATTEVPDAPGDPANESEAVAALVAFSEPGARRTKRQPS